MWISLIQVVAISIAAPQVSELDLWEFLPSWVCSKFCDGAPVAPKPLLDSESQAEAEES
jgi:hypothetical protein